MDPDDENRMAVACYARAMDHVGVMATDPTFRWLDRVILDPLMSPEFGSIEEYLGEHTNEYYDALNDAHGPRYQPERDASNWVAFCVKAHLAQVRRRLAQIRDAVTRWGHLEQLVESVAVGHPGCAGRFVLTAVG